MRANGLCVHWLSAATWLTALTVIVSLAVAYLASGSFAKSVSVVDLRNYGGTTFTDLGKYELWRVAVAQMLHAKLPHMLFNALCLLLLGSLVEKAIGPVRLLMVWLVAGGLATVLSPVLVEAPWDVGTGASQAVFAFAGCAAVLAAVRAVSRKWTIGLVGMAVGVGLILDFLFAGHPKPGHVAGLVFGAVFGLFFLKLLPDLRRLPTKDS